jgi:hypothetical protein
MEWRESYTQKDTSRKRDRTHHPLILKSINRLQSTDMEDLVQEIIKEVTVGVMVNVITPSVESEWGKGWKRDYEAGGISSWEPDEETAAEGA